MMVNGSNGFIPLSFCRADGEKTNINRKKEISSLFMCSDASLRIEENFQSNSNKAISF